MAQAVTAEAGAAVACWPTWGPFRPRRRWPRREGTACARVVHARGDATGAEITRALLGAARDERACGAGPVPGRAPDRAPGRPGRRRTGVGPGPGPCAGSTAGTVVLATGGLRSAVGRHDEPPGVQRRRAGGGPAGRGRGRRPGVRPVPPYGHGPGHATPGPWRPKRCGGRGPGCAMPRAGTCTRPATKAQVSDLSPRDVVSRSMARRMAELGADHCLPRRDAHRPGGRWPNASRPSSPPAVPPAWSPSATGCPVSPTAHYTMGGVLTDAEGRTTLEGLMAVGEVGLQRPARCQPPGLQLLARRRRDRAPGGPGHPGEPRAGGPEAPVRSVRRCPGPCPDGAPDPWAVRTCVPPCRRSPASTGAPQAWTIWPVTSPATALAPGGPAPGRMGAGQHGPDRPGRSRPGGGPPRVQGSALAGRLPRAPPRVAPAPGRSSS